MKIKYLFRFTALLAMASLASPGLFADQAEDEAAIRKSVATYVTAFNNQDAKTVASLWSPDAAYTNAITGEQVTGREQIEAQLIAIFEASKDVKIEVDVASIQFVSPSVAIEQGTARVLRPTEEPDETVYSSVYIKAGGLWLLDRMTEEPKPVFRSNYSHLKDLQWMIGTWIDSDGNATVETTSAWTKNQNFITRKFSASIGGVADMAGIQLIGWDPVEQEIRSWVFDSDGGFGSSTWKKKEDRWVINSTATLSDGRQASAIKIITMIDENNVTWQATSRAVDGEILPNIKPIKLTRNSDTE